MKLFDILPPNFFSVLASPNRQLYIDALFLLQDCFSAEELIIRRDYYAERLRERLGNTISASNIEEDAIGEEEDNNSELFADKASLIIRRLAKCGWVIVEMIENQFDWQIFIPDYASDILNLLRHLTEDRNEALERNIRTAYALLKTAEAPEEKLEALEAAHDNFRDFEKELIKVFTNMKRYHQMSTELENVNDLLNAFLTNYQENIDRKYISPLSRSNSVERYRTEIKNILSAWTQSDDWKRVELAWISKHSRNGNIEAEKEIASEELKRSIEYIEERLDNSLPSLVGKIKEKDSIYKERTIARIKYKSQSGKNVKKALLDLIKASSKNDNLLEAMSSSFSLSSVSIYDSHSLYERREKERIESEEDLRVDRSGIGENVFNEIVDEMRSQISNDEIDSFVLSAMGRENELRTNGFGIANMRDFMFFILSTIRAEENDSPYYMENFSSETVRINGASFPDVIFRRRDV